MAAELTQAGREPKARASVMRWFLLAPLVILLLLGVVVFRMVAHTSAQQLLDRSPIALLLYQIGQADAKGDLAESVRLRRLIQVEFERVYGRDHQKSRLNLYDLATAIAKQGGLAEAMTLCRRALEGQERILGPTHIETLGSLGLLVELLMEKGDVLAAEPFAERVALGLQNKLGAEHPDTKHMQDTLAEIRAARAKAGGK